jgi:hypothetical protein
MARVTCPACKRAVRPEEAGRFDHRDSAGEPCAGRRGVRKARARGVVTSLAMLRSILARHREASIDDVARLLRGAPRWYVQARLAHHARTGNLRRVRHGVYALAQPSVNPG